MKIQKDCKVELAASTDKTRSAIGEPYLDITDGKGTVVATDGKIMALVPVVVAEGDTPGFLSAEVLKLARKTAYRADEVTVSLNGMATVGGTTMPREGKAGNNQFPKYRQVIPADEKNHTTHVALDAKRLWQLAQAMGTQCVILKIETNDKPMWVALLGLLGLLIGAAFAYYF